jgi:nucleotide-binding universal stress UspA family protein
MRALLAVDDSEASFDAAAFAHRLLHADDDVVVLNVARLEQLSSFTMGGLAGMPAVVAPEESWEAVRQNAWRVVQDAGAAIDATEGRVELGDPGQRICDVALEERADLIVMGTRDRGLLDRIFSPSVSHYVVSHAPCSVLVVR